ncbi:rod shape-determining protein MreC [Clostridium lundense]|uniref:rod shape-determining protein MreC n=1 Tax=Clostridium lundense TaxID=319475 RepID=UPI000480294D|nr:rod shape-determining protein MreC [Clostridium lundense]
MNFLKNKLAVTIVVLSVTFLALIGYSYKRDKVSFVENGVGVTVNSVQGIFYNMNSSIKGFMEFFWNFSNVKKENEELKQKNIDLEIKASEYDVVKAENDRLREMLNFKNQTTQYNYVGCDIKGKSGGAFLDEFVINKGRKDGIEKQMPVVTNEGLVGQITSVADNYSIVQTLSNENMAVSGIIQSTRESVGIVKGYKDSNNSKLAKLYYLPLDSKIKKGDVILTSGIGSETSSSIAGLYPKGIRIGYVIDIEEDKGRVMKNAVVQPYVDFNKLEEVFVIVPKNKLD